MSHSRSASASFWLLPIIMRYWLLSRLWSSTGYVQKTLLEPESKKLPSIFKKARRSMPYFSNSSVSFTVTRTAASAFSPSEMASSSSSRRCSSSATAPMPVPPSSVSCSVSAVPV